MYRTDIETLCEELSCRGAKTLPEPEKSGLAPIHTFCEYEGFEDSVDRLAGLLLEKRWTLATAESCTGGLLGACLTDRAGASAYYKGGVVSYCDEVKEKLLGVEGELLDRAGAVSHETAGRMAYGAAQALQSEVGVSVTGLAGPESDGSGKPVGLVYVGLCVQGRVSSREYRFEGGRREIRAQAVRAAVEQTLAALWENVMATCLGE